MGFDEPRLMIAYVVQSAFDAPWPHGAAYAVVFSEIEAQSLRALLDAGDVEVRRVPLTAQVGRWEKVP